MRYILDLHIHSAYARACSKSLSPENISYWARMKGLDVVGTGDFTHPKWLAELKSKLKESGNGLFQLNAEYEVSERKILDIPGKDILRTQFMLSSEVSCIYSKGGKVRRVHILLYAPDLQTVEKINMKLKKIGRLESDGRPILGLDAKHLAEIVFEVNEQCMVVPAHAWTPWFAVFGSKSGFDSLEECFEELTPKIYAIETGLSSDLLMNYQVSALDRVMLMSNSDAHSSANLAREANIFELPQLSYDAIWNAVKTQDIACFPATIEFYPEEGMYHFDGHRLCQVSMEPKETKKHFGLCPTCKKPLTIGVLNRVRELSDREYGYIPDGAQKFYRLVGLDDIIADAFGVVGKKTKRVMKEYQRIITQGESELSVLLEGSYVELEKITDARIVEGIRRNREGDLYIEPGFDGQYGKVKVFSEQDRVTSGQNRLL